MIAGASAGAIDGVDAAAKQKVNATNKSLDVNWEKSYVNAEKTKTYCVYTGPSEAAVREAAKRNGLPVDVVKADAQYGVKLLTSYGTADRSGSYWVYEAPSFAAVRSAARASGVPFESIVEIPATLYPY